MTNRKPASSSGGKPSSAMRMPRKVEPQITYSEPRAIQIRERSVVMMRDQMQPAADRSSHSRTPNSAATVLDRISVRKNCAERGRSVLVDALLRLGRLQQEIDQLVGEAFAPGQRLLIGAPHRRLTARIEHGAARLPFGVADHLRHFQAA